MHGRPSVRLGRFGLVATLLVGLTGWSGEALGGNPTNPILFVTQVPMPEEVNSRTVTTSYMSCVSPFANHLGATTYAGRGGSLYERFSNGQVVDLLAAADWGAVAGGKPAQNRVAVRNPSVNWAGNKAIFSMVIGAPAGPSDTTQFVWQLYEIDLLSQAALNLNAHPAVTLVANQPAENNVFPAYGLNGTILFASDHPYNGQGHLLQREEYLGLPTVSGLWRLDPSVPGSLKLLHHSPSGAFSPEVDSAGRVIFTNWDHLSRDSEAVTDSRDGITGAPYNETFTQTFNGSGNFANESPGASFTQVTAMAPNSWDIFPEPRNFDRKSLLDDFGGNLNGNSFNIFLPWMINQDGTNGEVLNHVGRHEIGGTLTKSFKNDANIVDLNPGVAPGYGGMGVRNFANNVLALREDPTSAGSFLGVDAQDVGTHGAGQIIRLTNAGANPDGSPKNPNNITVVYVTAGSSGKAKPATIPTVKPSMSLPATGQSALTSAETIYRTPAPLSDGNIVASEAASVTQTDYNTGTVSSPTSLFTFRLTSLKLSGGSYVPDVTLTSGSTINTSYYDGATLVSYNGPAWELDPVEVAPRTTPSAATSAVEPIEAAVFDSVGVHLPTFQSYLVQNNAALSVSRNVTKRDLHDRQQPFNLKVAWSATQTTGASGTVYSVGWVQFFQADLLRGYLLGGGSPAPGRRVVATPLHDTMGENVASAGAPAGSVRLGDDGSFAAVVPAGKALTWQLLDNDVAHTSQVKERFWVTFQAGEIRTCANCHGLNSVDQTGSGTKPTNSPQALAALLTQWKGAHPSGVVELAQATDSEPPASTQVDLDVTRTAGSTGPAHVDFATVDGSALAGMDYTAQNGTLDWADGDTSPKTISIDLSGATFTGSARTFDVVLGNPLYASLGSVDTTTVAIDPLDSGSGGAGGAGGTGGSSGTSGSGGASAGTGSAAGSGGVTAGTGGMGGTGGAGAAGAAAGTGGAGSGGAAAVAGEAGAAGEAAGVGGGPDTGTAGAAETAGGSGGGGSSNAGSSGAPDAEAGAPANTGGSPNGGGAGKSTASSGGSTGTDPAGGAGAEAGVDAAAGRSAGSAGSGARPGAAGHGAGAGTPPADDSGCGCRVATQGGSSDSRAAVLAALGLLFVQRRKRRVVP